jgi:transmembrane 9 superfamily protein 3
LEVDYFINNNTVKENIFKKKLCSSTFTEETTKKWLFAVEHQYYYQLFLDDLPMWSSVGGIAIKDSQKKKIPFIYTHMKLMIGFNEDRVFLA